MLGSSGLRLQPSVWRTADTQCFLSLGDVCGIAALAWLAETMVLPSGTVQFALQLDAQPVRILMTNETECLAVGARRCPH